MPIAPSFKAQCLSGSDKLNLTQMYNNEEGNIHYYLTHLDILATVDLHRQ